jgi:PAS domain S-box-containing protein
MKASSAGIRRPLLVALAVFFVALAPFGWLSARIGRDIRQYDRHRLSALATSISKALTNDSARHQRLMQRWHDRMAVLPSPPDEKARDRLFEDSEIENHDRFRAIGHAAWVGNRLLVLHSQSRGQGEQIAVGTDLAAFPEIRAALENESGKMRGMTVCALSVDLPGVGVRNLLLTSMYPGTKEGGVIFASVVPADFLNPISTKWQRVGTTGGNGNEYSQDDELPGVAEGLVRVEEIPPGAKAPLGDMPEMQWDGGMGNLHLLFRRGPEFSHSSRTREPVWIMIAGGTMALLLAALAWMQARQREKLQIQVAERTAELGLYKAIVVTTSDLVGLCDLEGKPIFMNPAGRAMLGINDDEALEDYPLSRIYPPPVVERFASEGIPHASKHGFWSAELNMLRRGVEFPVSFVGVAIPSADGRSLNLGFIARNITAQRLLDQQLRETLEHERDLLDMKSRFVNTVTHEFRTPLAVILSSCDILSHYLDRLSDEDRQEHLNDIFRACQDMSRMLGQVLDLGTLDVAHAAVKSRSLELSEVFSRIADESASATPGGNLEISLDPNLAAAAGDETLLRHIFLNLISNARKYSAPASPVKVTGRRDGADAVFTVTDQGIGIPAADLPRLFESFSRGSNVRDAPGTGLGLSIVKRSVTAHGGTVFLTSEEGRGTAVTIILPLFSSLSSP